MIPHLEQMSREVASHFRYALVNPGGDLLLRDSERLGAGPRRRVLRGAQV